MKPCRPATGPSLALFSPVVLLFGCAAASAPVIDAMEMLRQAFVAGAQS